MTFLSTGLTKSEMLLSQLPGCAFNEDDNLDAIDTQIQVQENQLIALKTHRNGLAPISRLASEILCRIFDHLRMFPEIIVISAFKFERNALEWTRVTQVCHSWREIAINCPSLWTKLPFDFSDLWTKEMLQRSKSAKLFVDLSYSADRFRKRPVLNTARVALSQTWRIYSLYIIDASLDTFQKLVTYLPNSAPELEVLLLLANDGSDDDPDNRLPHDPRYKLPDDSLNEMNRLRSLEVVACGINWEKHLSKLNHLTFLRIESIHPSARPSAAHFWDVLSHLSPVLEKLHLCDSFPLVLESSQSLNDDCKERLTFANLRELRLNATSKELQTFLNGVTISSTTSRTIIRCVDSSSGDVLRAFCDALECSSSTLRGTPMDKLDISSANHCGTICIALKLFPGIDESEKVHKPPKYVLAFSFKATPVTRYDVTPAIEKLWIDIFATLPTAFGDLSRLVIQWEDQNCVEAYGRSVSNSNLLTPDAQCIFETTARLAFKALQQPCTISENPLTHKPDVLMPNLKNIELAGLHFGLCDDELTVDLLIDCFTGRKMHGAQNVALVIVYCSKISSWDISLLEEQGVLVHRGLNSQMDDSEDEEEWDEDEIEDDSYDEL